MKGQKKTKVMLLFAFYSSDNKELETWKGDWENFGWFM